MVQTPPAMNRLRAYLPPQVVLPLGSSATDLIAKETGLNKFTENKQRLKTRDFARGIAIILIVWAHYDMRMEQSFYEITS